MSITEQRSYFKFHGAEPDAEQNRPKAWIPGKVYLLGQGIDIGYVRATRNSHKDSRYVHDFKEAVTVVSRDCFASAKTSAKLITKFDGFPYSKFPQRLHILGYNLGFSYNSASTAGARRIEVQGKKDWYLCTDFSESRILVIVDNKGVRYVFFGGSLYVNDWIYN